jgi:hypothetical protein
MFYFTSPFEYRRLSSIFKVLPELIEEIPLASRRKMWYLFNNAPPHHVQNAAHEIRENRGILNRVRLSWTRPTKACRRW